jgi:hypothetical protein
MTAQTPSTAAQSMLQQLPIIPKSKLQGAKMLAYILDKKLLDNRLSFWLPFRANQVKRPNPTMIKDLKIDFSERVFDRD